MASSDVSGVSSHFSYAAEGFITTTSGSTLSGATTIPLTSVSGLTTGNVFVGIIEPGLTKQQVFTGIVDVPGAQITSVVYTRGSNTAHSAGVTIVDYVTGTGHNMLSKGMLVSHKQAGTMIDSLPLTTPKITTSINDSGGNEVIKTPATSSAVNEITVTNAATGNVPSISATGGDSAINLNLRGKGLAKTVNIGAGAVNIFPYDYVASGLVITADSVGVNKNYSMALGVVVINGNPVTVAAVSAQTVGASKDRYIDVLDNGDGTGLIVNTEVANNAASPALASNSIRVGIVVAGATFIATSGSVNQGQEICLLPIASSTPYAVTDSLGNLICPRDPNRKILGYREVSTSQAGVTTEVDATGLSVPVIVPSNRKIRITCNSVCDTSAADTYPAVAIKESTTYLQVRSGQNATGGIGFKNLPLDFQTTPTTGSHTYKIAFQRSAGTGTITLAANAVAANTNGPTFIRVELC